MKNFKAKLLIILVLSMLYFVGAFVFEAWKAPHLTDRQIIMEMFK